MQSFFVLLDRVFHLRGHGPLRPVFPAPTVHTDSVGTCTNFAWDSPQTSPFCKPVPRLDVAPRKRPLRVKLHRDSSRDCNSFPTRLVISGRMADVHAELERLAAMETMA